MESHPNIKVIYQENSGPSSARNIGIQSSNGKFILPLDSDDMIHPDYIQSCLNVIKQNDKISPVYCDTHHIGQLQGIEQRPEWTLERLKQGPFIVNCSMFRKEAFDKCDGYDVTLFGWEDYDLWIRMGINGFIGKRIPKPLFYYFHHEKDGTVSTQANKNQQELYNKIITKNFEKMTLDNLSNKIYVINLKTRPDRREHIIKELDKVNCNNYTIVEAVDGKELVIKTKLNSGMLGLNHTYLKIYDEWKKEPNDNIIIIEDDCVFLENFNEELSKYMLNVPNNWEMLYFGGNHNYHVGSKTEKINEYCIKLNNTYTAHCVLLKNYVFEELIENIRSMEIENDVFMAKLQRKYNAYSTSKNITTQLPNFSDIQNKFIDYNWLIK